MIVVGTNWVWCQLHIHGVRGSVGKEVGNAHTRISPSLGEGYAAFAGGVIFAFVGGARIEADEKHVAFAASPLTPQGVAIFSANTEVGPAFDVVHYCDDFTKPNVGPQQRIPTMCEADLCAQSTLDLDYLQPGKEY